MTAPHRVLHRVAALLAAVFALLAPLAAPAVADPPLPPTRIDHHGVWWGDGPYGEEIQVYRIRNTLSGDVDVAVIGWTEIRDGKPVRMAVAVATAGSQATKVTFDVFENGVRVRSEVYDRAAFAKLTGKELVNKHAEQLLKFWADAKKITPLVKDGQSEIEPCTQIGKNCRARLDDYFPEMTDFYYNIPGKPAGGESATSILNKILRHWKTAGQLSLGSLSSGGMFVPVGYPAYLNTFAGLSSKGGGTALALKPAPAPGATAKAPGGIDFSTLELRYLADPGPGAPQGVRYAFRADGAPADRSPDAGRVAALQSSDAFFVWLELPPETFWVNLNPDEPDRVIDPRLGTTDAGRILLQADLQMKKTVAKLIHPDSATGRLFWQRLASERTRTTCLSFRQWISPAPARIYEEGDGVHIVDAPLTVQLESEFLKTAGVAGGCRPADQSAQEALYRSLILPKIQQAVNQAPEYAELRRVHLSRVAAEWYRQRTARQPTRYADMIERGDVSSWPARRDWSPRAVFDQYVKSYTKGEFRVTHRRREGSYLITETYFYGGVDLSRIPLTRIDRATFQSRQPGLDTAVPAAMTRATADPAGKVWIGSVTAAPEPPPEPPAADGSGMAQVAESSGNRWLWVIAGATLAALLLIMLVAREGLMSRRARTVLTVLVLVTATGFFLGTRAEPPAYRPPPVSAAAIPAPVVVGVPRTEPRVVATTFAPTSSPTSDVFATGTCLTGTIPNSRVAVPAYGVTEVSCKSKKAHYKVIKAIYGTSDMNRCNTVRRTQYAFSKTRTRNGVPISRYVYCLIGLGKYAR